MIAEPINCHSGDSLFELSRVAWAIHTAWSTSYLIRGLPQTSVRDMNFQDRMFPYSLYCSIQYKLIEQIAIFLSLFSLSLFLLLFFSFSLFMTSIFVSFDIHFSLVHVTFVIIRHLCIHIIQAQLFSCDFVFITCFIQRKRLCKLKNVKHHFHSVVLSVY